MKPFERFVVLSVIFSVILISGCVNNEQNITENNSSTEYDKTSFNVEKVELIHFHGTNQCYSCITVGSLAEETVNTYFSEELKSGKVTFVHVNAELPENRELVLKYNVTSASLWIGVYDKNGFHPEQNVNVWYKISNKDDYMSYLKGIIEKRLSGDFT
ncbi:MAG: nitrophenyl compound nitroreductase subunit ArsF family protein [Candidatus Aenigmarchaeota archaeon]|nr:nitrophenyl compound nitroreductase subunit ArsF family protein [Candidatus Aenigmarchaeota archaeon]